MEEIRIVVDSRERNTELLAALESAIGNVEIKTLNVGDYIISDRVCIERKTVHDFESSIVTGRLFEQVKSLKETYEFPIVLIEGEKKEFSLNYNSIRGAVISLYLRYGMQVIFSEGIEDTADILLMLAKREQIDENRIPSLKGGKRAYTDDQFREFVIGNLPGIGPKLAKSILKHFKSIGNLTNADISDIMKVEKIGRKKAEMVKRIIDGKYTAD